MICSQAWAQTTVSIDGLKYNLNGDNLTAEVAEQDASTIAGDITIPETITYEDNTYTVTSIADAAFINCDLTSITIPNIVTSIGYNAFEGCLSLTSVTLPDSLKTIGYNAFTDCANLTGISIPNGVTEIGGNAFNGCISLTSIIIPESVSSIGDNAFSGCSNLAGVMVEWFDPAECTCGTDVFKGIDSDAILHIPNGTFDLYNAASPWKSFDTVLEYTFLVTIDGLLYSVELTNNTASVRNDGSTTLSGTVTIPETITYKGKTFTITSISDGAFAGCTDINGFNIPTTITYISDGAFYDCSGLTEITIPASVTNLAMMVFSGCTNLKSVTVLWTDPTTCSCDNSTFEDITGNATLYVPTGTKSLYEATSPWKKFSKIEEYDPTGIRQHTLQADNPISACYNTSGQRITKPQQGQVVIVKYADGTSRKVLVK